MSTDASSVNLDEPRWDQKTYEGRARHFFTTTNPMNLLCTPAQLDEAKAVVDKHRLFIFCIGLRTLRSRQ